MAANRATTTDDAVLTELACAKVNLGLKILGRRQDGYHEVRSILQSVDVADVLHFRPALESGMSCTDPDLSTGADNLVMQAASLFHRSARAGASGASRSAR